MLNIPIKKSASKKSHGVFTTKPCFAHDMKAIDIENLIFKISWKKETNLFSFDKCLDCLISFVKSECFHKSSDFFLLWEAKKVLKFFSPQFSGFWMWAFRFMYAKNSNIKAGHKSFFFPLPQLSFVGFVQYSFLCIWS